MAKQGGDPSYPPFPDQPCRVPSQSPADGPGLEIPTVDLGGIDRAGLVRACGDVGLFRLANHGIPSDLTAGLLGLAQETLGLPFESKKAQFDGPGEYFWGTPAVSLRVKEVNWVEGFHVSMGRMGLQEDSGPTSGSSSSFGCLLREYCEHMARIARALFDAIAVEMGLDEERSIAYLSESDGTFRVYRYPRCPSSAASGCYLGMEAHTDSSVLSILNQDAVGGLQILHKNIWYDVAPVPDTLVVNLGDMMQAISSDKYKSAEHRVLATPTAERLSLCYFAFPAEDCVIRSSKYRPFTYKQFRAQVQEDIKATGSKVGLKRFEKVSSCEES